MEYVYAPRAVEAVQFMERTATEVVELAKKWPKFAGISLHKSKTKITIFEKIPNSNHTQPAFTLALTDYLVLDMVKTDGVSVVVCQGYPESMFKFIFQDLDYENIVNQIKSSPKTWLPAILVETIYACVRQKVFKDKKNLLIFAQAKLREFTS